MARPPAPQVELIARPTGAVLQAPTSNRALELAASLEGVNSELQPALVNFGKQRQAKLAAKAEADAMAASGEGFAEAVRSGKIKKTQNPWYIQAYEKNAAAVRGQAEVSSLVEASQSFASRNNAAEFQKEFTTKLGEIAQKYQGVDQAAGFQSVADPLAQQTIQQNVQYNVKRIQTERVQDAASLATTAILAAKTAAGGRASPSQILEAQEPARLEWMATGGSEVEWDQLAVKSIIDAGYNSGDVSVLAALDLPRGDKPALSSLPGMGEEISQARYRIEQNATSAGLAEIRAKQNAIKIEGLNAAQLVWDQFGYGFLSGQVSKGEIVAHLQANGVSPQGAAAAIGVLQEAASDNTALSRALMETDVRTLEVYTRGVRKGYSPGYEAEVADMVRTGKITAAEGQSWISAAQARSNHFESEARSDARAARSDASAARTAERQLNLDQAKSLKDYRENLAGAAAQRLESAGIKTLRTPKSRAIFEQGLSDAESASLIANPGDHTAARLAVDTYAATYIKSVRNKKRPAAASSAGDPGNARR